MKKINFLFLIVFGSFVIFAQGKANKFVQKGNEFLAVMDFKKAEEYFNKALSIDSNCTQAYVQKSDIEIQKNDFNKALNLIERAKEVASMNNEKNDIIAHIYSVRSFIYFNLNNYPRAIEDLNFAISLDDQNSNYFFMRALIRRMNSDLKGCCADLKKASNLGLQKANESLAFYCK